MLCLLSLFLLSFFCSRLGKNWVEILKEQKLKVHFRQQKSIMNRKYITTVIKKGGTTDNEQIYLESYAKKIKKRKTLKREWEIPRRVLHRINICIVFPNSGQWTAALCLKHHISKLFFQNFGYYLFSPEFSLVLSVRFLHQILVLS